MEIFAKLESEQRSEEDGLVHWCRGTPGDF